MRYCNGVGQKGLVDCDAENGQCEICYMADLEDEADSLRADATRYRKLQRYMASNVKEGWKEVEMLGAICAWMSMEDMDQHLDWLPACNVGLCEINSSPENS